MDEKFTNLEIEHAIEQWLGFGEEALGKCQQGYFSGNGWAARVLRFHLEQIRKEIELVNLEDQEPPDKIASFPYNGDSDAHAF